ncbi:MAG: hypothetical protein U0441_28290 [Polyangiaceae bacterium]
MSAPSSSARVLGASLGLAGLWLSGSAGAQEIKLNGPLATTPDLYAVTADDIAARTDVTAWLSLGATPAPARAAGPFVGGGAEVSLPVKRLTGVLGRPSELRWGPWGQAWVDAVGGRYEGGLLAQLYLFGPRVHSPFDVRVGGGAGDDALGKAPHVALTLSGGPRYIEAVRWPAYHDERGEELSPPQLVAGWRFFFSARRTLDAAGQIWVTVGVELELGQTFRSDWSVVDAPR